jgi:hypothetical protein
VCAVCCLLLHPASFVSILPFVPWLRAVSPLVRRPSLRQQVAQSQQAQTQTAQDGSLMSPTALHSPSASNASG